MLIGLDDQNLVLWPESTSEQLAYVKPQSNFNNIDSV